MEEIEKENLQPFSNYTEFSYILWCVAKLWHELTQQCLYRQIAQFLFIVKIAEFTAGGERL